MADFVKGQRVILSAHGRDYATFEGYGEPLGDGRATVMLTVDGRAYNPQPHWLANIEPAIAERDMVIGDLLNLDMLKERFEVEFLGTLWTHGDSGMMTPYVCECSFGDGLKLIKIAPINQRPNYHIVRIDSRWHESSWARGETVSCHIDDVLMAIEEECGRAGVYLDDPCDNCGDTACRCGDDYSADEAFPALDDENGCGWATISWREFPKSWQPVPAEPLRVFDTREEAEEWRVGQIEGVK